MKEGETRTFYLRDERKTPVACVAYVLESGVVTFAVSMHNPMDVFKRSTARNKAIGRLNANSTQYKYAMDFEGSATYRALVQAIADDSALSTATRKAAKLWLRTHPEQEEVDPEIRDAENDHGQRGVINGHIVE